MSARDLATAYAILHHVAAQHNDDFEWLEGEDDPNGNKIHFKVMTSSGDTDVSIADHLEQWLLHHAIDCTRYRERGLEIEGKELEALVKMGADIITSPGQIDYYMEMFE